MRDRDVLEHTRGHAPAAGDQATDGGQMRGFLVGRGDAARALERLVGHRDAGRLGPEQVKVGAQRVRHHEIRTLGERRVDGRDRIADEQVELAHRGLVMRQGKGRRAGERVAADVGHGHG